MYLKETDSLWRTIPIALILTGTIVLGVLSIMGGNITMGIILFAIVLIVAVIASCDIRRRYKKEREHEILLQSEQRLRFSEERFRLAIEGTSISIWEYSIAQRRIVQYERSQEMHGFGQDIENVPDSLIETGFVHPDYADRFRAMYDKIFAGEEKAEGIFLVQKANRTGYWYEHIRYTTVFDEKGIPYKAIGMSEDVTEKIKVEQMYDMELTLKESVAPDAYATAIVNITMRTLDEIQSRDNLPQEYLQGITFENIFSRFASKVINNQKAKRQLMALNSYSLEVMFENNEKTIIIQQLRRMSNGEEKWCSFEMHLIKNPYNKHLMGFIYLRDIDEEKRQMEVLELEAKTDSLTGLYNRRTFQEKIREAKSNMGGLWSLRLFHAGFR